MEKIINGLKQIKNRIDSGTITTVNGTEHLLSKQLEELLKTAINYSLCCEELPCKSCNGHGVTELDFDMCNDCDGTGKQQG